MLVFFYVVHDVIDVEVLENSRTAAAVNILPRAVYNGASVALLSVVPELSPRNISRETILFQQPTLLSLAQRNAQVPERFLDIVSSLFLIY